MCLYVDNDSVSKTSDEDITVYKVLMVTEQYGTYLSPYRKVPYELGMVRCPEFIHSSVPKTGLKFHAYVEIGIHTFANLDDAKLMVIPDNPLRLPYELIIMECTIPKGTAFFKGIFIRGIWGSKCDSYASEVLIVNKIVEN